MAGSRALRWVWIASVAMSSPLAIRAWVAPERLPAAGCVTEPCTRPAVVHEMTPVADTWYEIAVPRTGAPVNATPQGSNDELYSGWWDIGIDQRTLMRFVVPTVIPDNRQDRAELEVAITSAGIGTFDPPVIVTGTIGLVFRPVLSPWEEATLSSLSPPESGDITAQAVVAWGPCSVGACGTARIDVTPLLIGRTPGTAEGYGLIMDAHGRTDRPSTGTWFTIASRESGRPPVLRIVEVPDYEVTATPTPTVSATATALPSATMPPALLPPLYVPFAAGGPA